MGFKQVWQNKKDYADQQIATLQDQRKDLSTTQLKKIYQNSF